MDEPYRQSYGFTCGPAALLTILHHLDRSIPLDHDTELDIWRDANLAESFATSAHGLALAALRRGFVVRLIASTEGIGFDRTLREHFPGIRRDLRHTLDLHTVGRARHFGLEEEIRVPGRDDILAVLDRGHNPLVLISTSLMGEDPEIPHWVIVLSDLADTTILNPETGAREVYGSRSFYSAMGFDGYKAVIEVSRR